MPQARKGARGKDGTSVPPQHAEARSANGAPEVNDSLGLSRR